MNDDDEPGFWSENWAWILVPALIVVALALYFLLGGAGEVEPFEYQGF